MSQDSVATPPKTASAADTPTITAVSCGVLAVLAAWFAFWLVPIPIVLGIAALVLGLRVRARSGSNVARRELAIAAIVLGLVGILAGPAGFMIYSQGEDWGRHCVVDSSDPYC